MDGWRGGTKRITWWSITGKGILTNTIGVSKHRADENEVATALCKLKRYCSRMLAEILNWKELKGACKMAVRKGGGEKI